MGRPFDSNTGYRMSRHKVGNYLYASTQRLVEVDGVEKRKYFDWGKLDDHNIFTPLPRFLDQSPEERAKFIFPDNWDITSIQETHVPEPAPAEDAVLVIDQAVSIACNSRFYGGVWLLERIAEELGLREDLMAAFSYNQVLVDDVMTISMFLCLTGYNTDRLAEWQQLEKYPSKRILSPQVITELEQAITCQNKMDLFRCRVLRVKDEDVLAVDSSTKISFNGKLINAAWGQNKEGLHLPVTLEVTVYSLKQHAPVYTTTLLGNLNDSRSVDIMIAELKKMGLYHYILIMDRAYPSLKNLRKFIINDIRIIGCMKVNAGFALSTIKQLGIFEFVPEGFTYSEVLKLYVRQFDISYSVKCDDGSEKSADRLKLNLYFDPVERAEALVQLDQGKIPQREELTKAIQKGDSYYDLEKKAIEDHYDVFNLQWKKIRVPIEECPEILKAMKDEPEKKEKEPQYVDKYVLTGFSRNDAALRNIKKTAGFQAIITLGQDMDPIQVMLNYGLHDEQEKDHEVWKTSLARDRERNSSESAGIGSSLIQFAGRIMYGNLRYRWKKDVELRNLFRSTSHLLDEMRKIKCFEYPEQSKLMITPFAGKQLETCKLLGYSVPKGCEP